MSIDLWLKSLLLTVDQDYEVCIVNDGGDEYDILGIIRQYENVMNIKYKFLFPRTMTFRVGIAKNLGAEMASGERIFITDPDCLLHKNVLKIHAGSTGIVGGIRHHIPPAYSMSLTPKCLNHLDKISYPFDYRYTALSCFLNSDVWMWQLIWGCNFSLSLSDFWSVGGFSTEFVGWGYEDLDLISRLVDSGIEIGFNFNALVYHIDHGQNRASNNRKKYIDRLSLRGLSYSN